MAGFGDQIRAALQQFARRRSLDELRKQGVKQIQMLGIDRIAALIEESVHRSLKSRLHGVERETVSAATKQEFLRLLQNNDELRRERTELQQFRQRAEEELDRLRRELHHDEAALRARLAAAADQQPAPGADAALAARVQELFQACVANNLLPAQWQGKVAELVATIAAEERTAATEARAALRDREIENLQRRIEKLNGALVAAEHQVREVTALRHLDQGISSIYREVQGVDRSDRQYTRRNELMAAIFEQNLALQKGSGTTAS